MLLNIEPSQLSLKFISEECLNIWSLRADTNPGLELIQPGATHPVGDKLSLHEPDAAQTRKQTL